MRACGQRNIQPIVDDDARRRPSHRIDTCGHKLRQRTAIEIALPDLHQVHTGPCNFPDLRHERGLP
jgi:hypothetical protein